MRQQRCGMTAAHLPFPKVHSLAHPTPQPALVAPPACLAGARPDGPHVQDVVSAELTALGIPQGPHPTLAP